LGVPSFSLIDPATTPEKRGVFSPVSTSIGCLCRVNSGDFSKLTRARSVKLQYVDGNTGYFDCTEFGTL